MKILPANGYILIEFFKKEEKTASGIFLTPNKYEYPESGNVLAVGDPELHMSGKLVSTTAKVGDKILFRKGSGNEVEGEKLLLKFSDVLAVIKDD